MFRQSRLSLGGSPIHTHTRSHSQVIQNISFLNNVPFFFLGGALLQLYSSGAERKSGARKTHYPPPLLLHKSNALFS